MRNYGLEGLRRDLRKQLNLVRLFEMYARSDGRFEVPSVPFKLGLVAFRLIGYNHLTSKLFLALQSSNKVHMCSHQHMDKVLITYVPHCPFLTEKDVGMLITLITLYTNS